MMLSCDNVLPIGAVIGYIKVFDNEARIYLPEYNRSCNLHKPTLRSQIYQTTGMKL